MNEPVDVPSPKKRAAKPPGAARRAAPKKRPVKKEVPEPAMVEPPPPPSLEPLPDYDDPHRDGHHFREFLRFSLKDRRLIVVGVLLTVVLAGWLGGVPLYREVKLMRAMQLLDRCQAEADSGDIPAAFNLMSQAILMAPTNGEVFRKIQIFKAGIGDAQAFLFLQSKMMNGQADTEELTVIAEQSFNNNQVELCRAALDRIPDPTPARKLILQMRLLDAEGRTKEAVDLARNALSKYPPSDVDRILLASGELVLKKDVAVGHEILRPLMNRNDAAGIAALRLLTRQKIPRPNEGDVEASEVITLISKHPLATAGDKLLEADLRIAVDPGSKNATIKLLVDAYSKSGPLDGLEFARWLNRRREHAVAIEFIGRDRALGNPEWFLVYLDAHAGLEKWGEVFSMLDAETIVGLSDSIRLLFLARAAQKSGDTADADDAWREMHRNLAYEKPEVASFVANYTAKIGETGQAFKAFSTMSKQRETALQGYLGMIRFWPPDKPMDELIATYTEMLEEFPGIGEAQLDLAYLQLLTNANSMEAAGRATELYRLEPSSLATLSVAALGYLRNGSPMGADNLYEGKTIPWDEAPHPWRAVRVAVLHANGKTAEAMELAATINPAKLRPEERELLETPVGGQAR